MARAKRKNTTKTADAELFKRHDAFAKSDDRYDTNRRDVLSVTAGAVASLAIAPAAYAANDPIFAAIKKHRDAATAHEKAVEVEFAFEEECGSTELAEKCQQYRDLRDATGEALDRMVRASVDLVATRPTTLVGVAAVLWHVAVHMEEDDSPGMPLDIHFGSTQQALAIFCENWAPPLQRLRTRLDGPLSHRCTGVTPSCYARFG